MKHKYIKQELQNVVLGSYSIAECLRKLNMKSSRRKLQNFKRKI